MSDLVGPLLLQVLDCAEQALDPPVGRVLLAPGAEVAWDSCCDGQLWVRVLSRTPQFVQPTPVGCGVIGWTVTLGLGVLRCASTVDDSGRAPSAVTLIDETLTMLADAEALWQAIQCCATGLPGVHNLRPTGWEPLGPQGGCVGGEWGLTALLGNCFCEEES